MGAFEVRDSINRIISPCTGQSTFYPLMPGGIFREPDLSIGCEKRCQRSKQRPGKEIGMSKWNITSNKSLQLTPGVRRREKAKQGPRRQHKHGKPTDKGLELL